MSWGAGFGIIPCCIAQHAAPAPAARTASVPTTPPMIAAVFGSSFSTLVGSAIAVTGVATVPIATDAATHRESTGFFIGIIMSGRMAWRARYSEISYGDPTCGVEALSTELLQVHVCSWDTAFVAVSTLYSEADTGLRNWRSVVTTSRYFPSLSAILVCWGLVDFTCPR